jgi:hypothetical protein
LRQFHFQLAIVSGSPSRSGTALALPTERRTADGQPPGWNRQSNAFKEVDELTTFISLAAGSTREPNRTLIVRAVETDAFDHAIG